MIKKFQPVIKWTGSKRSQVDSILSYFPKEVNTFYEPFCGGCSVLYGLLNSDIKVNRYVISDLNQYLINLWNIIKNEPIILFTYYTQLWNEINSVNDVEFQKSYYNTVKQRFNKEHNPMDFFFLLRTCFNGMIRYNNNGEFNTAYHINRPGINPDKLHSILLEWSNVLNTNNVEFICSDYKSIQPQNKNDFIYLDPPYAKTKGLYYGALDNKIFFEYLRNLNCSYILSYDGISGDTDSTVDLDTDLFDKHVYLNSGNSSFKRIVESDNQAQVYESLYIKNK